MEGISGKPLYKLKQTLVQYAELRSYFRCLDGSSPLCIWNYRISKRTEFIFFTPPGCTYPFRNSSIYERTHIVQSSAVIIAGEPPRGMRADLPYPNDDSGLRGQI
ncbi:hypothetical protein [Paenibacillus dendritiformis]|uniref:hypothetical protein n=1 Tax=Paenibacillus dendritiformis TaxID=130049 RepID=UPI00387E05D5